MQNLPIADHEIYSVNDQGEIHSGKLDLLLKPRVNSNGYCIVSLDQEQVSVHRIVALHFIPNPYGYPQVNHKNGDKQDNRAVNLEWCSAAQNNQHALCTGLRKGFVHVDVKRAMLRRAINGELVSILALEVGNHPNTLNRMLRVQAEKDGVLAEWKAETARKRKRIAQRNLRVSNANN